MLHLQVAAVLCLVEVQCFSDTVGCYAKYRKVKLVGNCGWAP